MHDSRIAKKGVFRVKLRYSFVILKKIYSMVQNVSKSAKYQNSVRGAIIYLCFIYEVNSEQKKMRREYIIENIAIVQQKFTIYYY